MTSRDGHEHWQGVYATKGDADLSWHQSQAELSLELIRTHAPDRSASIIDVGGGTSNLVDDLLAAGYADVTVLDIAEVALARARARLGDKASKVDWITADITRWSPARIWNVWHDRATFHFLTEPERQEAYIAALLSGTAAGATVILSTFALDGPEKCSGLPVQRYSPESLAARLGAPFALVASADERHLTPWRSEQHFVYAVFERGPPAR